jgi:predicted NAD/FAD-binding protein
MRIAIIGAGISGMVAAYLLCQDHDIVVFEANDYVGGHTHTVDIERDGATYAVDTGFIVFNEVTYPNFVKLIKRLGVSWQASRMSFSFRSDRTGLEFSPSSLNSLFAQRRNLFSPSFYRMVADIFRFRRQSEELLARTDHDITLHQYLHEKRYSEMFVRNFIIPMGAAIWSADPRKFNEFPAKSFVQFFKNHGFLNVRNQPQWLVIKGGSKRYAERLTDFFREKIRLSCPVASVKRLSDCVEVIPQGGSPERFDQVIIATHSDQALSMLADPSDMEREILGAIPYQKNATVLHTDISLLPRHKTCWASWNYIIPKADGGGVAVTYNMNILQNLHAPVQFCVTLNLPDVIDPGKTLLPMTYHHPVYTLQGLAAQKSHERINGTNRTYFCGAYWGYGFHEDGVNSALAVCKHFGKEI